MSTFRHLSTTERLARDLTDGIARVMRLDPLVWVWTGLLVLALATIIFSIVRRSGRLGLIGMLLSTLAAGAGVLRQLEAERMILDARSSGSTEFLTSSSRAAMEQAVREGLDGKRALAHRRALTALALTVLGAFAALGRRGADRELAPALVVGFLILGTGVALGGYALGSRALPVERYDFAVDDEESWALAITVDEVLDDASVDELRCRLLDQQLGDRWGGQPREWPRVMRRPVPPALSPAWQDAAARCITASLARLETAPSAAGQAIQRQVLGSPLLQDERLRERALAWSPR